MMLKQKMMKSFYSHILENMFVEFHEHIADY